MKFTKKTQTYMVTCKRDSDLDGTVVVQYTGQRELAALIADNGHKQPERYMFRWFAPKFLQHSCNRGGFYAHGAGPWPREYTLTPAGRILFA